MSDHDDLSSRLDNMTTEDRARKYAVITASIERARLRIAQKTAAQKAEARKEKHREAMRLSMRRKRASIPKKGRSTLSRETVRAIYTAAWEGRETYKQLAKRYGVAMTTIQFIAMRYNHVEETRDLVKPHHFERKVKHSRETVEALMRAEADPHDTVTAAARRLGITPAIAYKLLRTERSKAPEGKRGKK